MIEKNNLHKLRSLIPPAKCEFLCKSKNNLGLEIHFYNP